MTIRKPVQKIIHLIMIILSGIGVLTILLFLSIFLWPSKYSYYENYYIADISMQKINMAGLTVNNEISADSFDYYKLCLTMRDTNKVSGYKLGIFGGCYKHFNSNPLDSIERIRIYNSEGTDILHEFKDVSYHKNSFLSIISKDSITKDKFSFKYMKSLNIPNDLNVYGGDREDNGFCRYVIFALRKGEPMPQSIYVDIISNDKKKKRLIGPVHTEPLFLKVYEVYYKNVYE
ncbi:MAG: hypothetical protein K5854_02715 [Prevotella sp.]|nr:hypothetical protein [Prevotella sp.]